jgi:hypothetical protein
VRLKKTPAILGIATVCLIASIRQSEVLTQTTHSDWYAAPNGSASNSGTIGSPLSLSAALSSASPARPGDTIWLRGGTYSGSYVSDLQGTSAGPILVRQYPGERAVIDANNAAAANSGYGLLVQGAYTWFMGFEILHSGAKVDSGNPNSPSGIVFGTSNHTKVIDLVVHDMPGLGIGFWNETTDSEVYGSLIYYNGINSRDHGMYAQNRTGTKKITDNILFANAGYGLHLYASSVGSLNNFDLEGNVLVDNGAVRQPSPNLNQMVFGGVDGNNETFKTNVTYNSPSYNAGENVNFGYSASLTNAVIENNYFIGGDLSVVLSGTTPLSFAQNRVYGPTYPSIVPSLYSNNTYYSSRPTGTWVLVRPNQYEPGRANVTVYNWGSASQVGVDVSSVLASGDTFEIRDAQNFYGSPVASGTYAGGGVTVPMASLSAAQVLGRSTQPTHTPAEFGAFVLLKTSSGGGGGGDTTAPSVNVTAPTSGQTVNGTITVSATASDNTAVAGVQFQIDGANAGSEDTSAPFSVSWASTGVSNGTHTVTAIARDAAGNRATSAGISITVANPPTAPSNLRIITGS